VLHLSNRSAAEVNDRNDAVLISVVRRDAMIDVTTGKAANGRE